MNKIAKVIIDCKNNRIPAQFSAMSTADRDEAIRKELLGALGLGEVFEKKAFINALRNPVTNRAMFEIIEEIVADNFKTNPEALGKLGEMFCDIKNISLGDTNSFYIPAKGKITISEYSGSHMSVRRQRVAGGASISPSMRSFIAGVYVYVEMLLSGRETLEKFVTMLDESVARKIKTLITETFNSAVNNVPTTFKVTGAYDEDAILEMLAKLEAVNENGKPVLFGTPMAIRKLQGSVDITKQSDNMKNEAYVNFTMPVWNGYQCVELEQSVDDNLDFVLDNKIYAICGNGKFIKVVYEGLPMIKENSNDMFANADLTVDYIMSFKMGCAVAYDSMIGIAEII